MLNKAAAGLNDSMDLYSNAQNNVKHVAVFLNGFHDRIDLVIRNREHYEALYDQNLSVARQFIDGLPTMRRKIQFHLEEEQRVLETLRKNVNNTRMAIPVYADVAGKWMVVFKAVLVLLGMTFCGQAAWWWSPSATNRLTTKNKE